MKKEILNDYLLNEGIKATIENIDKKAQQYKHKSENKTIAIIFLILALVISTCITGYFVDKSEKMEYKFKQCSEIEAINQATINELTHDNMNLVNNK